MKLGKIENGEMKLVEVENRKEIDGEGRDLSLLFSLGFELVCETNKSSDDDICEYERISNGWIQIWHSPIEENEEII